MPRAKDLVHARTQHHRVTVHRNHRGKVRGMHHASLLTPVGKTAHFEISYLTKLRSKGAKFAEAILENCEHDYEILSKFFGGLTPKHMPFVVEVTADNSGASHSSCMGTDIAVGANSGTKIDLMRSLMVAEADEVFMANFGRGWNCGASTGEGLSRVLANVMYPGGEVADFIASNSWLNLKSRPNWVTRTDPSDTHYRSLGCSVLFLNWLRFQHDYSWEKIIAAGGRTLNSTYLHLTGKRTAWEDFTAFMDAHFPRGRTYRLKTDNPFPL
jgi:hypothetical protein